MKRTGMPQEGELTSSGQRQPFLSPAAGVNWQPTLRRNGGEVLPHSLDEMSMPTQTSPILYP